MSEKTIDPRSSKPMWQALGLAWELGYTIAIPLVIFALAGRLADKWLGTAPWLLIVGIILSIYISTLLVYRKTKNIISAITINEDTDKKDNNNSDGSKL
jgi:ATP synthase protein I